MGLPRFTQQLRACRGGLNRFRPERGVILVSSGDNFLAGVEFNASLEKGVPFYDSIALDLIGYDAMASGNHELDFGPDGLADFILGFTSSRPPFLRANLEVSQEPRLQALKARKRIGHSVVVNEAGERIGIVGATIPRLPYISSPRNVKVNPDVAGAIQAEGDLPPDKGIDKIVLLSHLRGTNEDLELAPLLPRGTTAFKTVGWGMSMIPANTRRLSQHSPRAVGARPPGHGGGTRAIHPGRARHGGPATPRRAWGSAPRRFTRQLLLPLGVHLLAPSPPEGPISCRHLSALTVGLPLAAAPAAAGRRQLELMPVLSHGTPRDLDGFGRQALDQLLVSERVGRVLRRH